MLCCVMLCYCVVLLCSLLCFFCVSYCSVVFGASLFYALHCLFCDAVLCCSALCYSTPFRVVLFSPCVKNTMNSTAPQNMQVALKFCSSVGDLTLFLPSVILFFRPSAPFSFPCRNYYTSFIALW